MFHLGSLYATQKRKNPFTLTSIPSYFSGFITYYFYLISLSTYATTSLLMKSSKAGSYHLLSCIRFQFSFIVPNLKHVRIHSTHPYHSLSLSTFLSRVPDWLSCA